MSWPSALPPAHAWGSSSALSRPGGLPAILSRMKRPCARSCASLSIKPEGPHGPPIAPQVNREYRVPLPCTAATGVELRITSHRASKRESPDIGWRRVSGEGNGSYRWSWSQEELLQSTEITAQADPAPDRGLRALRLFPP